jgi:hypothetical protein
LQQPPPPRLSAGASPVSLFTPVSGQCESCGDGRGPPTISTWVFTWSRGQRSSIFSPRMWGRGEGLAAGPSKPSRTSSPGWDAATGAHLDRAATSPNPGLGKPLCSVTEPSWGCHGFHSGLSATGPLGWRRSLAPFRLTARPSDIFARPVACHCGWWQP